MFLHCGRGAVARRLPVRVAKLHKCVGCCSGGEPDPAPSVSTPAPAPVTPAAPAAPAATATPQLSLPIRIAAGATGPITDGQGNKWLADQGFADGDTIQRPDITITNTPIPQIFHAEHYGMTSFSEPVPNGHYTVKLYFCETYEGITGPGERVFSFKVQNNPEVKDFDVWAKAGGPFIAYVVTPVRGRHRWQAHHHFHAERRESAGQWDRNPSGELTW